MKDACAVAGVTVVGALVACIMIINMFGGIVSGIWLAILGEWVLILIGFALSFVMPTAWLIAALPAYGICALAFSASDSEPRRSIVAIVGLVTTLWQGILIGSWTVGVFLIFTANASGATTVPLLLWGYSTTMAPLMYMAKHDDGLGTSTGLMLALLVYALLTGAYVWEASVLTMLIGVAVLVVIGSLFLTALGVAVTPARRTRDDWVVLGREDSLG